MTTKKTETKTAKPKTTRPRTRVKKVEEPVQKTATNDAVAQTTEAKGFSPEYLSVIQSLMTEPDRGLYISIRQNTATITGHQCDISHVVDMAALALFKAYQELNEEDKKQLSLQQAATAFINRLSEIARTQGVTHASDGNSAVQTSSES